MKVAIAFFLIFITSTFAQAQGGECTATCQEKGAVQVDLGNKCMCIANDCFKISIGKDGPSMTTAGKGKLHEAKGAKYQTKPGFGTTSYDNDAIAMGITGNDSRGKWIHKTRNCSPGGNQSTLGCIAVPCEHWPKVKAELPKKSELVVCGGGNSDAQRSVMQGNEYMGESEYTSPPSNGGYIPSRESR